MKVLCKLTDNMYLICLDSTLDNLYYVCLDIINNEIKYKYVGANCAIGVVTAKNNNHPLSIYKEILEFESILSMK